MIRYLLPLVLCSLALRLTPGEELSPAELAQVKATEAARIQAIESVYGAVVAIYGNDRQGGGSGVLYDEAGYALTNHHVVAAAGTNGWAGLADGKLYRWRLIGTDPGGDVAIIQLQGRDRFPSAPLGDSRQVRVGDFAMAMGNPFVLAEDQKPTVTLGIVSGVERFQPGSGLNQLVYGNCIQVDSSINPGNSGGPLFNIRGQVIGINGRGSFEERGRVNVGLGYAISSNQCKFFVPEIMATKIAQHGTLDALFGTREGKVICHTLNLDAPVARLGLKLGDELVAFEGHKIATANQFTNLLSMLPAGWPCELTFTREGAEPKTIYVRLTALPYETARPAPMPGEEPQPKEEEPKESKPGEEKPPEKPASGDPQGEEQKPTEETEKKPDAPAKKNGAEEPQDPEPQPRPGEPPGRIARPMRPPALPLYDAGKIRDAELNHEAARHVLERWQSAAHLKTPTDVAAIRLVDEVHAPDGKSGRLESLLAADGRCVVRWKMDDEEAMIGFDGTAFWSLAEGKPKQVTQAKALRNPYFWQAFSLAQAMKSAPFSGLGKLQLDGSDKALGQPAYRLNLIDESTEESYLWFSVFGDDGRPSIRLLKSGVGLEYDEPIPAVVIDSWQEAGGLQLPRQRRLVQGLAEIEQQTLTNQACEILKDVTSEPFRMPEP